MTRVRHAATTGLLTIAAVLMTASPALAESEDASASVLSVTSAAYPVETAQVWSAPTDEVMIWESTNVVKVDAQTASGADWIRLEFNASNGEALGVGDYQNQGHQAWDLTSPGILVIANGLGCMYDYSQFQVTRVERDENGTLIGLDLSFEHHCASPTAETLSGTVHFVA